MDSLASHRRSSMRWRCRVTDIQDAVRDRYAAKALQMASPGVTGRLDLACNLSAPDLATRREEWKAIDGAALIGREEAGGALAAPHPAPPPTRAGPARLVSAQRGRCGAAGRSPPHEGDK